MSRKHKGPVLVTHNTSRAAEAAVTAEQDEEVAGGAGRGKEREEEEQQEESAWPTRIIRHNGVVQLVAFCRKRRQSATKPTLLLHNSLQREGERERQSGLIFLTPPAGRLLQQQVLVDPLTNLETSKFCCRKQVN